jgi:hypothetical protein
VNAADQLRRAAATLRERAGAATPGPWQHSDANEGTMHHPGWMVTNDAFHNPPADEDAPWLAVELHTGVEADAAYIATVDPAVGLALADWLDGISNAERHEVNGADLHHALAVARAILGGTQ